MKARRCTDYAVDVGNRAAVGADNVVVVVIDPALVEGSRVRWFDPTNQPGSREVGKHVVHGLDREAGKRRREQSMQSIGVQVRVILECSEHFEAADGRAQAGKPQLVFYGCYRGHMF